MNKNITLLICFLFQLNIVFDSQAGEKVNETIDLAGNRAATWYVPDNNPQGWMLLQHGFQRNKGHLDDIATYLMDNDILVLTINSSVTGGNQSLAVDIANELIDNPPVPPNGIALPDKFVIAGHSAGGLFVSHMGGRLVERDPAVLNGAILFDPVDANEGMTSPLQLMADSGKPVLAILANSSSCNSSNNALSPLRSLSPGFVGIKLTDNSKHFDVEGSSTGGLPTWICGTPQSKNTDYVKDFTLNWALDMFNNSQTADYYPGGAKIAQLLSEDDGELIKEIVSFPPVASFSYSANLLSVSFTNSSSDQDGEIISFEWQFGDGNSSTAMNPQHDFASAGTYVVTLTVTDNDMQSSSTSQTIVVSDGSVAPNASFSYQASLLDVSFTDTSSDGDGNITSWLWDFGDGQTSNLQNPAHAYSGAGSYTVSLTVTDDDGLTDSISQVVDVTDGDDFLSNPSELTGLSEAQGQELHYKMQVTENAQNLRFAISGGTGDADIYVRFNAAPTTSDWDYRPYKNGNQENVEVASPQAGTWYIMIRAYQTFSNLTFNASYATGDNLPPAAAFSTVASGLNVSFNDQSSDTDGQVVSWLWNFGDGIESSEANPSHTYVAGGSYTVTLTVSDDDEAIDQISQLVSVGDDGQITVIQNGETRSGLAADTNNEIYFVLKNVPPQTVELNFLMNGGNGDADIYVKYGALPTTSDWDYRPYKYGNEESVYVGSPQAGDWYVMIRAYSAFDGVNLTASHTVN